MLSVLSTLMIILRLIKFVRNRPAFIWNHYGSNYIFIIAVEITRCIHVGQAVSRLAYNSYNCIGFRTDLNDFSHRIRSRKHGISSIAVHQCHLAEIIIVSLYKSPSGTNLITAGIQIIGINAIDLTTGKTAVLIVNTAVVVCSAEKKCCILHMVCFNTSSFRL